MKRYHSAIFVSTAILLVLSLWPALAAELHFGVESQQVSLNEPFIFQIQVETGKGEEAQTPTLPSMPDFAVTALEPQKSTSSHTTIINGKITSKSATTTIFKYYLTARREGRLTIPPVTVKVGKQSLRTDAILIIASKSQGVTDIFLECELSTDSCYVGEPVMLTCRWFFGQEIRGYSFNLPVYELDDFTFPEYEPSFDPQHQNEYLRLNNNQDKQIIARQTTTNHDGLRMGCVTFQIPLLPNAPGTFKIPAANVICKIDDNRRSQSNRRSRSPFDDFDDPFFGFSQPTRQLSFNSPELTITVREMPQQGRPDNFSGIIGKCQASASASLTEVNVGDPILVTIRLSGPPFLDNVRLPDFALQKNLQGNFRISGDEPGTITNGCKEFQRTFRATSDKITELPPLEIPFFNSASGKYEIAATAPIPLQVTVARQITAEDAQGLSSSSSPAAAREVQATATGLAGNYSLEKALISRTSSEAWLHRPLTILWLGLPPLLWLILLFAKLITAWHRLDPRGRASRQAKSLCLKKLRALSPKDETLAIRISELLQDCFSSRFGLSGGTITFRDLQNHGADSRLTPEGLQTFKEIFETCEAVQFAGHKLESPELFLQKVIHALETWED